MKERTVLARQHGAELLDVRDPGGFDRVADGRAADLPVKRVLTVGTDCAIGKMVACLELTEAARRAGWDAAFAATGQTGIMIEDEARDAIDATARETGLPVTDVIRFGCEPLIDALRSQLDLP